MPVRLECVYKEKAMEFLPLIYVPRDPSMLEDNVIGHEHLIKADNLQVRTTKQGFGVYLHEISFLYDYTPGILDYFRETVNKSFSQCCVVYYPIRIFNRGSESLVEALSYSLGRDGGLHFEIRNIVRDTKGTRQPRMEVVLSAIDTRMDLEQRFDVSVEISFKDLNHLGTPHHG